MALPSPSRNHGCRPGRPFTDAVLLPGWDRRSVWGWDQPIGSFSARLWRNGNTGDAPDVRLSGIVQPHPWPSGIALGVVEQTGAEPVEVVAALGIADPGPKLRPDGEVAGLLRGAVGKPKNEFARGAVHALGWAQGYTPVTPSLRQHSERPTAAQVDAEHHLATGSLYRPDAKREFFSGVDAALWWLLGRGGDTSFLR